MNRPTYAEQWQKITEAYLKDEIKPYDAEFCFCGTLNDEDHHWWRGECKKYLFGDFIKMEFALLDTIRLATFPEENIYMSPSSDELRANVQNHPNYEHALFNGMVAALEVLRQIHAEDGDETAIEMEFVKREIVTT